MDNESSMLWNQPDWIAGAQGWIEEAVRRAGWKVSGPIQQPHIRPWATVMRVPTTGGVLFFKAAGGRFTFEPALTKALESHWPSCTPEVVDAEPEKGWMLTRDGGTPITEQINSEDDLRLFDPILPLLAGLQMEWLEHEDDLLALGVFDRRLELLPDQFERLLADDTALMIGQPGRLDEAQYDRLRWLVPTYRDLCSQLIVHPVGQSLHYDDMHTNNILLRQEGDGPQRVTFNDWGDSAVSHPFCSLLIFLRSVSDRIHLPEEATEKPESLPPALVRLRDVYLEPWQQYDNHASLVEGFNLAWRVGMGARAVTWNEIIHALAEPYRPDLRHTVPAWLGEFLLAMK